MKRYIISTALKYHSGKGFKGFYTDPLVRINPRITKEFYIKSVKTGSSIKFVFYMETKESFWYKSDDKNHQITCELYKPIFNK